MTPKLIASYNGIVIKDYVLDKDQVLIGRHSACDIHIDDAVVSSRHAELRLTPNRYLENFTDVVLRDLGSTNGTLVNGVPVEEVELKNGDVIRVGQHQFTFQNQDSDHLEETAIYIPDEDGSKD
jgi:pSer/pThr/pTyr-binding forkhead associated (FHA) protein